MSFMPDGMNLHRDRNLYFPQDQAALGTGWNPLSVNTRMALSQNNRVANGVAGAVTNVAANSVALHSRAGGGKYYGEMSSGSWVLGGTNSPPAFGLASADCGDGSNSMNLPYVFGVAGGAFGFSGPARPLVSPGDTVMIAVDFSALQLWIGRNGVWVNGGDPALGTLPDGSGGGAIPAGTYRLTFMGLSLGTPTLNINIRSRFNANEFNFTPPTGFLPWGSPNT